MAVSTKVIKSRLRSIGNTKKITKAMEMVSAAKMRKAINAVLLSRAYSLEAWKTVLNLAGKLNGQENPLLAAKEKIENVGVILISSNRGLCAGFNSNIIQAANKFAQEASVSGQVNCEWLAMGKVGAEYLARNKQKIAATFEKPDVITQTQEITTLAKMAVADYLSGRYDKIMIAYTDFVSALIQKAKVKQLLPIEPQVDHDLGNVKENEKKIEQDFAEYLFEPNPAEVLNQFLPRMIEVQVFQAALESNASEHSARMMAMKNASEAATDMMSDLTLAFNQARQANITREIAEISGGKAALE